MYGAVGHRQIQSYPSWVTPKKEIRFKFPEPKKGIVVFDVTVEATDSEEAAGKLVEYLIELRRMFVRPPDAISGSNDAAKIGRALIWRLNQCTDPTAYVLTIHLFCEYWLNLVLERISPSHDLTGNRFAVKLDLLYGLGKIPQPIFENLKKLNALRNRIAHRPDFDFTKMDLGYHPSRAKFNTAGYKPAYGGDAKQHNIFNVLCAVMADTYGQLHSHCVEHLGFKKILTPPDEPPANSV